MKVYFDSFCNINLSKLLVISDKVKYISSKTPVVGISSLGLDHTGLLGHTLEQIAWQKGGILKPGALAFTSPQPIAALSVLEQRALDREVCTIRLNKICLC